MRYIGKKATLYILNDNNKWQELHLPYRLPYTSLPPTPIQVATVGHDYIMSIHYPASVGAPMMLLAYHVMFREVATMMLDQFMDAWLIRNTPFGYRFSDD